MEINRIERKQNTCIKRRLEKGSEDSERKPIVKGVREKGGGTVWK